jgi:hypothetical protein
MANINKSLIDGLIAEHQGVQYLRGVENELFDDWLAQNDLLANLYDLGTDKGKIALASLLTRNRAKAVAKQLTGYDVYGEFVQALRKKLQPDDLLIHWLNKLMSLELYVDERVDSFHDRLEELVNQCRKAQKDYFSGLSDEEKTEALAEHLATWESERERIPTPIDIEIKGQDYALLQARPHHEEVVGVLVDGRSAWWWLPGRPRRHDRL